MNEGVEVSVSRQILKLVAAGHMPNGQAAPESWVLTSEVTVVSSSSHWRTGTPWAHRETILINPVKCPSGPDVQHKPA